jgi:NhaP-type Na+/H+ or K+/H+ antiporter
MNDFSHSALVLAGAGMIVAIAAFLPHMLSKRAPGNTVLFILGGYGLFMLPGAPALPVWADDPLFWEKATEFAVVTALFGTGLSIDKITPWKRWHPTWRLLAVVMPVSIGVAAWLGWTILSLPLASAILLGAVIAPTDPVMAGDVQVEAPGEGGEDTVRFALTTEAGFNDGLAFPFTYLAIAVASMGGATWGDWGAQWVLMDVVYRIVVGCLGGIAIGWVLGQVLYNSPAGEPITANRSSLVALAGLLLAYGLTELVEGYGFLGAFLAGLTLRRVEAQHEFNTTLHTFTDNLEQTLLAVLLILFGGSLPIMLAEADWAHLFCAALIVLALRPVSGMIALWGHECLERERWAMAFLGVKGLGSLYYFAYAVGKADFPQSADVLAVMALVIIMSTVLHGLTANFVLAWLDRQRKKRSAAAG